MIEPNQLKRIVEAALLASSHPLSLPQLSALFAEEEMPSHDDLARAIVELSADGAERGVELHEVASGFRYQVRQDVHPWVARLWTERQTRYSRAQLETLALIAYRQPITRGEIEQIRGVAVSSNIIKTLEEREWIRSVGHRDVPGKPELFGTTRAFLDYFNLKSLDELPPLAEIRDLNEYDPQLNLAPVGSGDAQGSIDALAGAAEPLLSQENSRNVIVEPESSFSEEPADLNFSPLGEEIDGDHQTPAPTNDRAAINVDGKPVRPDTAASAESSPHVADSAESDASSPEAASDRDAATPELSA